MSFTHSWPVDPFITIQWSFFSLATIFGSNSTSPDLSIAHFSSVTQSCVGFCDPMDWSRPGFPVYHQLPELAQLMSIKPVMPSNHLILSRPLLLLTLIFPSIRVFSNESVLRISEPKYWSFSFSINPSNEYSGLISFRIDWFDLLAVQVTLKSIAQGVGDRLNIATAVYFGFHLHGTSFSILYFEHICVLKYEIGYLLM